MSAQNDPAAIFARLTGKVAEYERQGALTSGEVMDHYMNAAVGAPTTEAFVDLAARAAKAFLSGEEMTAQTFTLVAVAWMMGASAGAGAAQDQPDAIRRA